MNREQRAGRKGKRGALFSLLPSLSFEIPLITSYFLGFSGLL
jgi:hypothetical protein